MASHNYSAQVPPDVFRDRSIKITELKVYCEIEASCNSKKDMWATSKSIAEILGLYKGAVQKAIRALEDKGYIERWYVGNVRHIRVSSNEGRVSSNEGRGVSLFEDRGVSLNEAPIEGIKEKTLKKDNTKSDKRKKYGEFKHVLLTEDQHKKLFDEWGEYELSRMIILLDEGIEEKGYKYKNFYLAIRKWRNRNPVQTTKKANYI